MELKVIEKSKSRLVVDFVGTDHTICNAIKQALIEDKDVKNAGYFIEHPQTSEPRFLIEGSDPVKSLEKACDTVKKWNADLAKKIKLK